MRNLASTFSIHLHMNELSGIIKMQINNDLIQRSISQFNWERAFSNKSVNQQISIFNETILNIMTNFIPHGTKILNDQNF